MATRTITGLTAVLAGDLDDTAVFEVEDNDVHSRKATLAQMRTALSAAAWTITSTSAPQLTVRYDASNHLQVSVSSAGAVTLNATGASAAFSFSDAVTFATNITQSTGTAALQAVTATTINTTGKITATVNDTEGVQVSHSSGTFSIALGTGWGGTDADQYLATGGANSAIIFGINGGEYFRIKSSALTIASGVTLAAQAVTATTVTASSSIITSNAGTIYPGGDFLYSKSGTNLEFGLATVNDTGAPIMDFDHRGASNTGSFRWRVGTDGGTTLGTLSGSGLVLGSIPLSGITTLAGSGAVSGFTSWTGTGKIMNTLTTEQQRWNYDSLNYCTITVASDGTTTFDSVDDGSTGEFVFSDPVTVTGALVATGNGTFQGGSVTIGAASTATAGAIRLTNSATIAARNAADSANINLIESDGSNFVLVDALGQGTRFGGGIILSNGATPPSSGIQFGTSAPSSLANGQLWYDGTNLKARLGGATVTIQVA